MVRASPSRTRIVTSTVVLVRSGEEGAVVVARGRRRVSVVVGCVRRSRRPGTYDDSEDEEEDDLVSERDRVVVLVWSRNARCHSETRQSYGASSVGNGSRPVTCERYGWWQRCTVP